jgi:hypothetical protein
MVQQLSVGVKQNTPSFAKENKSQLLQYEVINKTFGNNAD